MYFLELDIDLVVLHVGGKSLRQLDLLLWRVLGHLFSGLPANGFENQNHQKTGNTLLYVQWKGCFKQRLKSVFMNLIISFCIIMYISIFSERQVSAELAMQRCVNLRSKNKCARAAELFTP